MQLDDQISMALTFLRQKFPADEVSIRAADDRGVVRFAAAVGGTGQWIGLGQTALSAAENCVERAAKGSAHRIAELKAELAKLEAKE